MVKTCREIFSKINPKSRWTSVSSGGFTIVQHLEDDQYEVTIQFNIEQVTRVA